MVSILLTVVDAQPDAALMPALKLRPDILIVLPTSRSSDGEVRRRIYGSVGRIYDLYYGNGDRSGAWPREDTRRADVARWLGFGNDPNIDPTKVATTACEIGLPRPSLSDRLPVVTASSDEELRRELVRIKREIGRKSRDAKSACDLTVSGNAGVRLVVMNLLQIFDDGHGTRIVLYDEKLQRFNVVFGGPLPATPPYCVSADNILRLRGFQVHRQVTPSCLAKVVQEEISTVWRRETCLPENDRTLSVSSSLRAVDETSGAPIEMTFDLAASCGNRLSLGICVSKIDDLESRARKFGEDLATVKRGLTTTAQFGRFVIVETDGKKTLPDSAALCLPPGTNVFSWPDRDGRLARWVVDGLPDGDLDARSRSEPDKPGRVVDDWSARARILQEASTPLREVASQMDSISDGAELAGWLRLVRVSVLRRMQKVEMSDRLRTMVRAAIDERCGLLDDRGQDAVLPAFPAGAVPLLTVAERGTEHHVEGQCIPLVMRGRTNSTTEPLTYPMERFHYTFEGLKPALSPVIEWAERIGITSMPRHLEMFPGFPPIQIKQHSYHLPLFLAWWLAFGERKEALRGSAWPRGLFATGVLKLGVSDVQAVDGISVKLKTALCHGMRIFCVAAAQVSDTQIALEKIASAGEVSVDIDNDTVIGIDGAHLRDSLDHLDDVISRKLTAVPPYPNVPDDRSKAKPSGRGRRGFVTYLSPNGVSGALLPACRYDFDEMLIVPVVRRFGPTAKDRREQSEKLERTRIQALDIRRTVERVWSVDGEAGCRVEIADPIVSSDLFRNADDIRGQIMSWCRRCSVDAMTATFLGATQEAISMWLALRGIECCLAVSSDQESGALRVLRGRPPSAHDERLRSLSPGLGVPRRLEHRSCRTSGLGTRLGRCHSRCCSRSLDRCAGSRERH